MAFPIGPSGFSTIDQAFDGSWCHAVYFKRDPSTMSKLADTMDAELLGLTNSTGKGERPSLLELTERLLDFLRVAPLVDYSPSAYFGAGISTRATIRGRYDVGSRSESHADNAVKANAAAGDGHLVTGVPAPPAG